jgi:hypothetical protein
LTTVPFLHTSSILKADDSLSKADRVPWISTHVIITKHGSPFKGYEGVVKDVLRGQDTTSGLKIVLQLQHHDPSSPFKTITVDYDDVVEQRSVKELHLQESILQVNMPSSKRSRLSLSEYAEPQNFLFQPSKAYMKSARRPFRVEPSPEALMPGVSGATPMPDQTSSLTPAWDPTSRTPRYFSFLFGLTKAYCFRTVDPSSITPAWSPPEDQHLATSSQIASRPADGPQHPLLDERLVGASLKVFVDDGGETYKNREVEVSIVKDKGVVSIRHYVYNTLRGLAPSWVLPKTPNPTRDNGLLMVVKGNHCGKYVRRIYHGSHSDGNGNNQPHILLAVVKKVDGAVDTLTGEQLELDPDSLCIAVETSKDKKLNAKLMNSLRDDAARASKRRR